MTHLKREIIGLRNERNFPHLVELALPPERCSDCCKNHAVSRGSDHSRFPFTLTYTASLSGQPQQNSQSGPVEQPEATTPHEKRARADEMGLATFALRMKYRGHERTRELPLTQDMITQLAFEAQFRNMSIGELVGELLIAIMKRDIFQHVFQPSSKQP
jgi:hypothetical protein